MPPSLSLSLAVCSASAPRPDSLGRCSFAPELSFELPVFVPHSRPQSLLFVVSVVFVVVFAAAALLDFLRECVSALRNLAG